MNIGIFTDTYLPDINGVVSSCVTLTEALQKAGHTVYVITNHPRNKLCREGNIIRLPGIELKGLYGYKMSSPIQLTADKVMRQLNLDVIHIQTEYGVGLYGRHVAKEYSIPLVYTYHTMWEDYTHYINPMDLNGVEKISKAALRSLSRTYANRGQAVIAPSEKTKNALLSYGVQAPIYIIPTGLDLSRFDDKNIDPQKEQEVRQTWDITPEHHTVIFVGRLAKEKMLEMVIEAIRMNPDPALRLLVTGSGPDTDYFKRCAQNDPRIQFAGKVPATDVPYYYKAADCFASASTSETQGMTYIEALAAGLPVFGRRDPVLYDLVEEGVTGGYFDDAAELSQKLTRFFEGPACDRELCRQKAAPYTTELFAAKVLAVYEQAMEDYKHTYNVTKMKIHDDFMVLTLNRDSEDEPVMIMVPMDDFFDLKLALQTKVDGWLVQSYLELQDYYRICILAKRKLASKDMTSRQVKEWAVFHQGLDAGKADTLVEELQARGLLDDEAYARDKASYWHDMGHSRRSIAAKLYKAGLADAIIQDALSQLDEDREYANAKALAARLVRTIKEQPAKGRRQTVLRKLISQGYTTEIARRAYESLELTDQEDEDALRNALAKAIRLYSSLEPDKRRQKIIQYCLRKGFSRSEIMDGLEQEERI